jgi:hypothetical protein
MRLKTAPQSSAAQKQGAPHGLGRLLRKPAGNESDAREAQADHAARQMVGAGRGRALQAKLSIGASNDPLEQEADRVADQVMAHPANTVAGKAPARIQRFSAQACGPENTVPASVDRVLAGPGNALDPALRQEMEPRFGADFSQVRVHSGAAAEQSARDVNAQAYTVGRDIVFGAGRLAPGTDDGRRLMAHELTHVVQQDAAHALSPPQTLLRYTEDERRDMAEGRVVGQANDIALAAQRHFEPGDMVFRLGSVALGFLMGQDVTHGGIYIGNGLIHDVVGFGNRIVRVSNFYNPALGEAANATTYRIARFQGPLHDLIVTRLLANIARRDFRMPTDAIPFNLFSTADDYRTATCLEYAHAQFLHAIRQLSVDQTVPESDRQTLRQTYFAGSAAEPSALIRPTEQRVLGGMASMSGGMSSSPYGTPPPRDMSAAVTAQLLVGAASAMATDVDPARFQNRSEGQYIAHWPGGPGVGGAILNAIMGMTYDEVVLRTFTYQSFVDSRQFFRIITP